MQCVYDSESNITDVELSPMDACDKCRRVNYCPLIKSLQTNTVYLSKSVICYKYCDEFEPDDFSRLSLKDKIKRCLRILFE